MEEVPETGAVFTFGKSRFGDDNANKFWVKNDPVIAVACGDEHTAVVTSTGQSFILSNNKILHIHCIVKRTKKRKKKEHSVITSFIDFGSFYSIFYDHDLMTYPDCI